MRCQIGYRRIEVVYRGKRFDGPVIHQRRRNISAGLEFSGAALTTPPAALRRRRATDAWSVGHSARSRMIITEAPPAGGVNAVFPERQRRRNADKSESPACSRCFGSRNDGAVADQAGNAADREFEAAVRCRRHRSRCRWARGRETSDGGVSVTGVSISPERPDNACVQDRSVVSSFVTRRDQR